MIRLRGASRHFQSSAGRRVILDAVDLEIEAGEVVAVLGVSGAGKSTLLRMVGGLDRDYAGQVVVGDLDLRGCNDAQLAAYRATTVGMVFQRFHLLHHLNVRQNIDLPATFRSAEAVGEVTEELLAAVGLVDRADAYPSTLSGGEQQRVAIARALRNRPAVILADEPTGNLDERNGAEVVSMLAGLAKEGGAASLWVTHEERVAAAADRRLQLVDGKLEPLS
jgi:putative ABC transport system ATP-binding protein